MRARLQGLSLNKLVSFYREDVVKQYTHRPNSVQWPDRLLILPVNRV